jgi:hypothetical protein
MLRLLITYRFGELPDTVLQRLENATADDQDLELWVDRVLTAETLEDVFPGWVGTTSTTGC